MKKKQSKPETVLGLPRRQLKAVHKLSRYGWEVNPRPLEPFREYEFRQRDTVEQDKAFKQVIPYVLVWQDGALLRYARGTAGQEKRLHEMTSIGFGGHVNERDVHGFDTRLSSVVEEAAFRELHEELRLTARDVMTFDCLGWVNTERTQVGAVHFGVVYLATLDKFLDMLPPEEICDPRWCNLDDLEWDIDLEPWSCLALKLYGEWMRCVKQG